MNSYHLHNNNIYCIFQSYIRASKLNQLFGTFSIINQRREPCSVTVLMTRNADGSSSLHALILTFYNVYKGLFLTYKIADREGLL